MRRFAIRWAVMERGILVEHGPTAALMADPQHPYTQKLVQSRPAGMWLKPPAGRCSAEDICVDYPVNIPGIRGWFRKGSFRAVAPASLQLSPAKPWA